MKKIIPSLFLGFFLFALPVLTKTYAMTETSNITGNTFTMNFSLLPTDPAGIAYACQTPTPTQILAQVTTYAGYNSNQGNFNPLNTYSQYYPIAAGNYTFTQDITSDLNNGAVAIAIELIPNVPTCGSDPYPDGIFAQSPISNLPQTVNYIYYVPPTPTPTPAEAPPVTTATLSPTPFSDSTYSDPTTVTLSATAASGYTLANTYYTIDSGSQQTYSTPFTVTGSGSHTITYWSVDNNGATEATNTQTFTITEAYSLSGTVFTDTNHNGVQDNGEQSYQAATLTLNTGQTETTDANGNYSFPSLESGSYVETVTLPSGYIATTTNPVNISLTANTTENFGIAPATTTLTPSADSFIQHNGQNQNEGASPFLELSVVGKERALIQFNESQIQAAIGTDPNYTAALQVTIISNNNKWSTGRPIDVHRMAQAWAEGNGSVNYNGYRGTGSGVTWDCATDSNIANNSTNCTGSTAWDMIDPGSWPFVSTPTATSTITNNQSGNVSFNVTSDVQAFLNGTTNNGWIIRKDDESQDGDIQFGSKESSNSPKLVITDQ